MPNLLLPRRHLLLSGASVFAAAGVGGHKLISGRTILASVEKLNRKVQTALTGRQAMAQEYSASAIAPSFRSNGTLDPGTPEYAAMAANNFEEWRLEVGGLVARPGRFSLDDLRALPARTQITRHDCIEGWSVIGKWNGVRLAALLALVGLRPEARYIVFRCADTIRGERYFESIDMDDALHEQTILAYDLNDQPLPVANGAPLRLRVERQLGYKMAKYVMRMDAVATFEEIGGKGGLWEAWGYPWYAGI